MSLYLASQKFCKKFSFFVAVISLMPYSAFDSFAQSTSGGSEISSSSVIFIKDRPPAASSPVVSLQRNNPKNPLLNFTNFDVDDGLALQSVFSGFKDRDGNLWFATLGGGVSKFDGKSFTNFDVRHGLSNLLVRAIAQTKSGNYFFGTASGLSVYDGEKIINYDASQGFPASAVTSLLVDASDNLWCGTSGGGLVRYDGTSFKIFTTANGLISNTVRSLESDKDGMLWVGTQAGVMTFDGKEFKLFKTPDSGDKTIYDIHQDDSGNMWFAGAAGVLRFNGTSLEHFGAKDGLSSGRVFSIGENDQGVLYFGIQDGGVSTFDGKSFGTITQTDGLPSNRILGIVEDAGGKVWFCSLGGGVSRYNGSSLVSYTTQQGLAHNLVWSIAQDHDGALWFAHENGLTKFDGTSFFNIVGTNGLLFFIAVSVDSKGVVWAGGPSGLSRWDGRQLTTFTTAQGLSTNHITEVAIDKSDVLWLCTEEGITRFDGKAFTNYTLEDKGNDHRAIKAFVDREGIVWVCTSTKIFKYSDSQFRQVNLKGFPSFAVNSITQDKNGFYWFGSSSSMGLVRYDGASARQFSAEDGLPNEPVFDMKFDPLTGDLWMGSNYGLTNLAFKDQAGKVTAAGALNVSNSELKTFEPVWTEYNRSTGYPLDDLINTAFFISSKNFKDKPVLANAVIWAGFADKLFRFDPALDDPKAFSPQVAIRNVKLDGRAIPWNSLKVSPPYEESLLRAQEKLVLGKPLTTEAREKLREDLAGVSFKNVSKFSGLPDELVLPHGIDHLMFNFGIVETSRNLPTTYQYRLSGQQDAWSYPSKESNAAFTNLWEGDYTFEVRAKTEKGDWTAPSVFSFSVLPPWWRSWPMYAAYVVGFSCLLFGFVKIRERRLKEEKRTLEKLVLERTQEVNIQKEEALHQKNLVEERNEEIQVQLEQTEKDLSNQTLDMIQRQNHFRSIEEEIERLSSDKGPVNFQKLAGMVKVNKTLEKEWDTFNHYFGNVHRDFYDKLSQQSPGLSIYEQRLAALIRMNMDNRQIATLLAIEVTSVKMAKYRLKKKLDLDESVDLSDHLSSL